MSVEAEAPEQSIGHVADAHNADRQRDLDKRLRKWGIMTAGGTVAALVGAGLTLVGGPLAWVGVGAWVVGGAFGLVGLAGATGNIFSRVFKHNR